MTTHDSRATQVARAECSSTRDRLVKSARELFWAHGYEATSVAQILDRAGVNSGSLYHFFAGKEELLLAVLESYEDQLWPALMGPVFEQVEDPIERVFALLAGYRQALEANECQRGCPIGNLALEVSDVSPEARARIARNFDNWLDYVRRCFEEAADRLPADTDLHGLAVLTLNTMEGAVMQARSRGNLELFDRSIAQLRDYFDRLLATRSACRPRTPERD